MASKCHNKKTLPFVMQESKERCSQKQYRVYVPEHAEVEVRSKLFNMQFHNFKMKFQSAFQACKIYFMQLSSLNSEMPLKLQPINFKFFSGKYLNDRIDLLS